MMIAGKFLCICCTVMTAAGCGAASNEAAATTSHVDEIRLSENVLELLQENSTMTAAVKAHQAESGLSLAEAKEQVEHVMKRDGISLAED